MHRDIKPDNLMLKQTWMRDDAPGTGKTTPSLVLVDFGSATFARGGKRLTGFEAEGHLFTPHSHHHIHTTTFT